jgi:hypothetical protein
MLQQVPQPPNAIAQDTFTGKRLTILLQAMLIGWLLAKKISWRVWTADRLLPTAPVIDMPSWLQYVLLLLSVLLLFILIIKPWNKALLISLCTCEVLSCLADQNRWQPWEYQYLFTLLVFIIYIKRKEKIIPQLAFILFAIYLYSGIGKFNEGYLQQFWSNMFLNRYLHLSEAALSTPLLYYSGYITACIEVASAALLLFKPTQRMAALTLMLMHVFILLVLGPFGLKYNIIIWPWNMLMMAQLYIIFLQNHTVPFYFKKLWKGWGKIVVISWGILPILNYAGLWDSYLSSRLYSGNLPAMVLCLNDEKEVQQLQRFLSSTDRYNLCKGSAMVHLQTWAMRETNIVPYPENRVYRQMYLRWLQQHPGTNTKAVWYVQKKGAIKIIQANQ